MSRPNTDASKCWLILPVIELRDSSWIPNNITITVIDRERFGPACCTGQ